MSRIFPSYSLTLDFPKHYVAENGLQSNANNAALIGQIYILESFTIPTSKYVLITLLCRPRAFLPEHEHHLGGLQFVQTVLDHLPSNLNPCSSPLPCQVLLETQQLKPSGGRGVFAQGLTAGDHAVQQGSQGGGRGSVWPYIRSAQEEAF